VHAPSGISITYSYFCHAILLKPLAFSFTSRFKKKKKKLDSATREIYKYKRYCDKPKFEHYALISS